jgi:hypothetical protein
MIDPQFVAGLARLCNPDGAYPFHQGDCSYAEPTLMMLLAHSAWGTPPADFTAAVDWCRKLQNADGSVALHPDFPDQGPYITAMFAVGCHHLQLHSERDRAIEALLAFRSLTFNIADDVNQLNSKLTGWSWAANTFSWVEPTAWALLALRLAGKESHPRAVEGREILKDRWIQDQGWNLGNKIVYNNVLIPFLDTTALAILALSEKEQDLIEKNLTILENNLDQAQSFYSQAWIGICLKHFRRMPDSLRSTLTERILHPGEEPVNLAHLGLGCLALAEKEVFFP